MYHMLKVAASGAQPDDMDLAPNDPATTSTDDTHNLTQTSSTEDPQAVINHLQQMVEKLTSELSKANLAIQHLQNQNSLPLLNLTTTATILNFPMHLGVTQQKSTL
ncbi:hypothetical protein G6F16_014021 [Rhizopus arrhizus]|nr:hypothetical protein G6F16_014021 [Rhizopus arrhizus]